MNNRHLILIDGQPAELVARQVSASAAHAGDLVALDANGTLDLSLIPDHITFATITLTQPPLNEHHAVTRGYVDARLKGLSWQRPVEAQIDFTTAEPAAPVIGERYINTVGGTGSASGQSVNADSIYEWTGSAWEETPAADQMALWDKSTNFLLNYSADTGEWIDVGSVTEHNTLSGLQGGTAGERYHLTANQHAAVSTIPDPSALADGHVLVSSGGEWVAMELTAAAPGTCDRYLMTADGQIFGTSLGALCLPED